MYLFIIQMTAKSFLYLILLSGLTSTVIANYILRPSQLQSCDDHTECGIDTGDLTLFQLINNFSDYLTNDTTLIFSSGNYSLESELLVENIHSFSMFAWPGSSSKVVIMAPVVTMQGLSLGMLALLL